MPRMNKPDLSIVIPVYRDAGAIEGTVATILAHVAGRGMTVEIILVNDGGPSETREILKRLDASPSVHIIDRPENRGKGHSVREGLAIASGAVFAYTDADLPYDLASLDRVADTIRNVQADIALASRRLEPKTHGGGYPIVTRRVAHSLFARLVRGVFRLPCSDTQAGLKAMTPAVRDALFPSLVIDRYAFDVELLYAATRHGFRLREVPATQRHSETSNVHLLRDSWEMLRDLWRIWKRRHAYDPATV